MTFLKRMIPVPLLIILLLMLAKGITWALVIPPGQSPDEPAHFSYVQYLGEENRLPVRQEKLESEENTYYSHELVNFLNKINFYKLRNTESKLILTDFERSQLYDSVRDLRSWTGNNYVTGYPPGYYWPVSLMYKVFYDEPIILRFFAARFSSVFMSLFLVIFSYHIARKVIPDSDTFPIVVSLMTGLQPMVSMISSSVNNDVLMMVFSAGLSYWLVTFLTDNRAKQSIPFILLGGVGMGCGLLIKAQLLYVVLFILLIVVLFMYIKSCTVKTILQTFSFLITPAVLIYSWWAIFSFKYYHSLFGVLGFNPIGSTKNGKLVDYLSLIFQKNAFNRIYIIWVKWFWAALGWLNISFESKWIYLTIIGIIFISCIGLLVGLDRWRRFGKLNTSVNIVLLTVFILFVLGNVGFLYVVEFDNYRKTLETMLQGRYLFTSIVPINILLLIGIRFLIKNTYHKHLDILFSLLIIAFNLASLGLILDAYYGVRIL